MIRDARKDYLHLVPPLLVLAFAVTFFRSNNASVFEPPFLLPLLNTVLLSALPFVIAFLAARSFVRQGTRMFVLYGCGMVVFGMGSLLGGWGLLLYGENVSVTAQNIGCFLGGMCHLAVVIFLILGPPGKPQRSRRHAALACAAAYAAFVIVVVVVSVFANKGYLPIYFAPDRGLTSTRLIVLSTSAITYTLSAILVAALNTRTRMLFLTLYSCGLFLTAMGLGVLLNLGTIGSALGWTGRTAQYAGSLYFGAAILVGIRETRLAGTSLPVYLGELFRSRLDDQVRDRTHDLVTLNERLVHEAQERLLAEEELRRSEERLRLAAESTGFGVYRYSFGTGSAYYSPELLKLFGLPPDAPLPLDEDLVARALHPDDRADYLAHMNAANDPGGSGILDLEYRILRTDGEQRWLKVRGRTTFSGSGDGGRPVSASGIVQDVTERRQAEAKIEEREATYRSVIENSLQGVAIIQDGRIVLCNEALCRMNGYSRDEVYRMTQEEVLETVHVEDRAMVAASTRALTEGVELPARVVRFLDKTGGIRWVEVLAARTVFHGSPAFQMSYVDVTERRRAEAAYHSLIDHAMLGMAILKDGRVVFANPALAEICGYSVDGAAPSRRPSRRYPLPDCTRTWRLEVLQSRIVRAPCGPEAARTQVFRIHAQGRKPAMGGDADDASSTMKESPALQVSYKDATTELAAEERLRSAHTNMRNLAVHLLHAREEERRNVAREIHDELGQTLAALKMDLHWLAKRLSADTGPVQEKIKGTIELGEQAISTVQRIAAYLRPRMLDDLGLAPALEQLGADFMRRTKITCSVTAEVSALIGKNAATTLYRIAQEALANVGRHSHADNASIRMTVAGGTLDLRVEDDGIGITWQQAEAPGAYGLIGLRERVEGLGGSLSITGELGRGTIVLARIPLPPEGGLA